MEYSIRDMAKQAGVPAHVLRYYEKEGLLPGVERAENGFRRYTEKDLEQVKLVCLLRETGMPVAEIREFAALEQGGGEKLPQLQALLDRHIEKLKEELRAAERNLSLLEETARQFAEQGREYEQTERREFAELREVLLRQAEKYPRLCPPDAVKLIYQNEFGGGHIIASPESSLRFLREETARLSHTEQVPGWEEIGGGLCRLELRGLSEEMLPTVNRLFVAGAALQKGQEDSFWRKITLLEAMAKEGALPFGEEELAEYLRLYRIDGCHMVSHSRRYREEYAPAYRILPIRYAVLLPLFLEIDRVIREKGRAVLAIDGRCGAGKSTFAELFREVYQAPILHMDDFFLPPALRTPERLAEPGGNFHRERFLEEAAAGLQSGGGFSYRVFDCSRMDYYGSREIPPSMLRVVEGSYSLHPKLAGLYDIGVFVTCPPDVQKKRIFDRSGPALYQRFLREWIPMEERYFETFGIRRQCRWILDSSVLAGCFVPQDGNLGGTER